jgi:hypothetical protein
MFKRILILSLTLGFTACSMASLTSPTAGYPPQRLKVSDNHRFLQYENGQPFFWLADTGWLLFSKLNRKEAAQYIQNRYDKGFNVIQVMVVHDLAEKNYYGDTPFINEDPTQPAVTPGHSPDDPQAYDYWDHVDYIVNLAAQKGIYMAMVPVWGSAAGQVKTQGDWANHYATWLAQRYKQNRNIIWVNGGDKKGSYLPQVWQQIGLALEKETPEDLTTFHPFGGTQSSTWFHHASWLDFNMFQSGHRRYDQKRDDVPAAEWKGEDNWRYVQEDYALTPVKPTLDGEPSYENIPQGLHDSTQPYWKAADVRRYAYWSVFAGAFGHTYGNNAVMQMHKPNSGEGSYGVRDYWYHAMNDEGAGEMKYLKRLMLSRPFFERKPDQSLLAGENGQKYNYVIATRGENYAFFYTYTGRSFEVNLSKMPAGLIKASWYSPRDGQTLDAGVYNTSGTQYFHPPGTEKEGNDWVLILDRI